MRHADEGALRRMLDEPFAVSSDLKRHIDSCAQCQARAAIVADEAEAARAALGTSTASGVDAVSAYSRFIARKKTSIPSVSSGLQRLIGPLRRRYVAPAIGALAAAVLVVAFVFTPMGTLAQSFLTIFEPHTFVAINISKGELQYMPDLKSFGTMAQQGATAHREVATAALASALTHIPARLPSYVPPNLSREAHYYAISPVSAAFQFSAARARAYAASVHKPIPPMPPGLDGSVLTLHAGPMIVVTYGAQLPSAPMRHSATEQVRSGGTIDDKSSDANTRVEREPSDDISNLPPLVVVEAVAPRVYSTGATTREIEDYLLAMPGVAPQLADEIRAIGDPSTTMPIPVPIDKSYSQQVAIDGAQGLAIGDNTGVGGMIVWQKNGIVYGVCGGMQQRQLMEIAQSLR
ncbi:MAG TPA: hypothetical protein VFO25_04200 [Candidatus Eremiobacteraceae bacterium]|nr:hypothetical protein [Candidatus Eremiobacteraceae bacterium]